MKNNETIDYKTNYYQLEKKCKKLEKEILELREENETLRNKIYDKSYLDDLKKIKNEFNENLKEKDAEIIRLQNELTIKIKEKDEEIMRLHEEIDQLRKNSQFEENRLNDIIIGLKKEVENLQKINNAQTNEINELNTKVNILENKLAASDKTVHKFIRNNALVDFSQILEKTKYLLINKHNLSNTDKLTDILEFLCNKYANLDKQIIKIYNNTDSEVLNYKRNLIDINNSIIKLKKNRDDIAHPTEIKRKSIRECIEDFKLKYEYEDLIAYINIMEHVIDKSLTKNNNRKNK